MHAPSVVRHRAVTLPSPASLHQRVNPASAPDMPAANDDATSAPFERRLNPLWAINVALAAFLLVAALIVASG